MKKQFFIIGVDKSLIKTSLACLLILIACGNLFAQHRGAPVQKGKLLRVLRSGQLPARDIVKIINRNGVNFQLTPEVRKELIAAGATPNVIRAVGNNSRTDSKKTGDDRRVENTGSAEKKKNPAPPTYSGLLDQANHSYKRLGNLQEAVRLLGQAARLEPMNPLAYQSLGSLFLYGLRDFPQAEKYMSDAIRLGGTVEFRVFHDDNEKFTQMCQGSLFISRNNIRFVSDTNPHNFETTRANVEDFKIDSISTPLWSKRSVFKFVLRAVRDNSKFRFSPFTEKQQESEIVKTFVRKV